MTNKTGNTALLNPFVDFLMVGGGALLFLIALLFFGDYSKDDLLIYGAVSMLLANFVNHPHFAHSYQIIYSDFKHKLTSEQVPAHMRVRYWWTGIIVPILIVTFFALCFLFDAAEMLGYAANVMFFLVGWHYVKQGYGILIVLSVKKRVFLTNREKNMLRYNGYVLWMLSWVMVNSFLVNQSNVGKDYLGLTYYAFNLPTILLQVLSVCAVISSVLCGVLFIQRHKRGENLPSFNGMVAYISAVYIWIFIRWIDPMAALFIPMFHSLQYLPFVWRYKYSQYQQDSSMQQSGKWTIIYMVAAFVFAGSIMGYLGFHAFPKLMDVMLPYDEVLYGTALFVFMWWIFINIHHYFIDNTIWRKDNRDAQKYLFS